MFFFRIIFVLVVVQFSGLISFYPTISIIKIGSIFQFALLLFLLASFKPLIYNYFKENPSRFFKQIVFSVFLIGFLLFSNIIPGIAFITDDFGYREDLSYANGDDFSIFISPSNDPTAKKRDDGVPLEFDVWKRDAGGETLLLERFDNNLNPNGASVAVSGRTAVIYTLSDELIFIDVDTKQTKKIPIIIGEYEAISDFVYFKDNNVVFKAWRIGFGGRYNDALFLYNIEKNKFKRIYKPSLGYGITEIKSVGDKIYWAEYLEWSPSRYYVLKL